MNAWAATGLNESEYLDKIADRLEMPKKSDFILGRGEPDEVIQLADAQEVWIYNDTAYCGVMIIIYPLMAPCDRTDRITFNGEMATKVKLTEGSGTLYTPGGSIPSGCRETTETRSLVVEMQHISTSNIESFKTTTNALKLRILPSEGAKVIAVLNGEKIIDPQQETLNWVEIWSSGGDFGWISKKDLEKLKLQTE